MCPRKSVIDWKTMWAGGWVTATTTPATHRHTHYHQTHHTTHPYRHTHTHIHPPHMTPGTPSTATHHYTHHHMHPPYVTLVCVVQWVSRRRQESQNLCVCLITEIDSHLHKAYDTVTRSAFVAHPEQSELSDELYLHTNAHFTVKI